MTPIYLTHMAKHGRGRMKHIQTFRASCAAGDKTHATDTLKEPEAIIHVVNGVLADRQVVVKLQEVSRLSEREAQVATRISEIDPPNVAAPICEFKCKNDRINWKQPIKGIPKQFCSGKIDMTSVFVMEYIPHNLITFLSSSSVPAPIYISILKQLGYALINLYVGLKMTHGDIGSGNLMLMITTPRSIEYTMIDSLDSMDYSKIYTVDTLGYEPILIDFQRSVMYSGQPDPIVIADELALTYDCISRWARDAPFSLTDVIDSLSAVESMAEVIDIVTRIGDSNQK